ncbi:ATP/GTP binding protein [Mycena leptocephala]|nr:ATP/GTP binding protein [Mycena leptocephala]
MAYLFCTYTQCGQFKQAEELGGGGGETEGDLWRKPLSHPVDHDNVAQTCSELGQWKKAEGLGIVVMKGCTQLLGDDHPHTLLAISQLANTYNQLGELEEAERLGSVVVEKRRQVLGEDHPDTLLAMSNLAQTYRLGIFVVKWRTELLRSANIYNQLGKLKEAEKLGSVVVEKQRQVLREDHPNDLQAIINLAQTCSELGQLMKAEELCIMVIKRRTQLLGDDHPHTQLAISQLANTYNQLGKLKEAEKLGVLAMKKQTQVLGENHPATLTMSNLINTYHWLG